MRCCLNLLFICCLFLLLSESASAQLFGSRTLGRSVSRRQPASMDTAGTVDPSRRFIRGQRSGGDFVGADRGDSATFVGNEQGTSDGPVTSSVTGLREQRSRSVNRPRRPSTNGRYAERLTINFGYSVPNSDVRSTFAYSQVLKSLMDKRGIRIEASAEEHSVILQGVVPSEHDRELVELFVLFEPGIEKVENELKIE